MLPLLPASINAPTLLLKKYLTPKCAPNPNVFPNKPTSKPGYKSHLLGILRAS